MKYIIKNEADTDIEGYILYINGFIKIYRVMELEDRCLLFTYVFYAGEHKSNKHNKKEDAIKQAEEEIIFQEGLMENYEKIKETLTELGCWNPQEYKKYYENAFEEY